MNQNKRLYKTGMLTWEQAFPKKKKLLNINKDIQQRAINHVLDINETEKLKLIIGQVYALGLRVGKEKAKFQTDEGYENWSKNKQYKKQNVIDRLIEISNEIKELFRPPLDIKFDMVDRNDDNLRVLFNK